MEINFNLPYLLNGSSATREDEVVLVALLDRVSELGGSKYLHSRPRVKPYHSGSTYGRVVTFATVNAFEPNASATADATMLRALLEGLISANLAYMQFHYFKPLLESGIYYKRTQVWDSILGLYERGYGDCKSLTAARVAQMRAEGIDAFPQFRWIQKCGSCQHSVRDEKDIKNDYCSNCGKPWRNGFKDFHILVFSSYGYEDPSRLLGMGLDENAYFNRG